MSSYAKTPTVFQMEATECGAASLTMIFAYYGKHLPLEKMRIETGVSRDGCVAGNIMRAAKKSSDRNRHSGGNAERGRRRVFRKRSAVCHGSRQVPIKRGLFFAGGL